MESFSWWCLSLTLENPVGQQLELLLKGVTGFPEQGLLFLERLAALLQPGLERRLP